VADQGFSRYLILQQNPTQLDLHLTVAECSRCSLGASRALNRIRRSRSVQLIHESRLQCSAPASRTQFVWKVPHQPLLGTQRPPSSPPNCNQRQAQFEKRVKTENTVQCRVFHTSTLSGIRPTWQRSHESGGGPTCSLSQSASARLDAANVVHRCP